MLWPAGAAVFGLVCIYNTIIIYMHVHAVIYVLVRLGGKYTESALAHRLPRYSRLVSVDGKVRVIGLYVVPLLWPV